MLYFWRAAARPPFSTPLAFFQRGLGRQPAGYSLDQLQPPKQWADAPAGIGHAEFFLDPENGLANGSEAALTGLPK